MKNKIEIELNEELYNFYKLASDNDKMTLENGIHQFETVKTTLLTV